MSSDRDGRWPTSTAGGAARALDRRFGRVRPPARSAPRRQLGFERLESRAMLAAGVMPPVVILMIGDGMGFQQVDAGRMFLGGQIAMDQIPYQAQMTTYSANSSVTDSAASATAMATGQKANNGVISRAIPGDGSDLTTSLEIQRALGKATGLVTTSTITDATPAAFAAHADARANTTDIANDLLTQSRPNVLLGGGGNGMTVADAEAAGYTVVQDRNALLALDTNATTYVSGQFGSSYVPYEYDGLGNLPHLSQMAATALDILDNDPDGFFLVIEGGRIDHAGHANDIQRGVRETAEFANTVQLVLDWAAGRTDTLVLVTADHETGGMNVVTDRGAGVAPDVTWTTTGHTGVNVPIYAWGAGAEMVTGVLDNTDIFRLTTDIQSVGAITSTQWTGLDLSAGDRLYRGQATRDGLLTIEATLPGATSPPTAGEASLTLYDENLSPLATGVATGSHQRIDWSAQAGATYYFSLHGTAADVDLRLANLVQIGPGGSEVTVYGTDGDDTFEATAGAAPTLLINSIGYEVGQAADIQFLGSDAGADTALLTGSPGDDAVVLHPGSGTLTASSCTLQVSGVGSITANGGGGSDTVRFYDSPGRDALVATPTYGQLSGDGYRNVARSIRRIEAYATAGGVDEAKLYDSPGNDEFVGTPTFGRLRGDGFSIQAENFDGVHAYATAGGADVAKLYDSPGNDTFYSTPTDSALYGPGYFNRVKYFDGVHAYATAGGTDAADLYDSAGNDNFYASPVEAALYGAGFYNRGKFFEQVDAHATAGGVDEARLYDSSGNDDFVATPTYARLQGDGFSNRADSFQSVRAYATGGGIDVAKMFDSPGNDLFVAMPSYASLQGNGFYNRAEGFDGVHGYATAGGVDVAKMYDSPGDDNFYATPTEASLYGNGFYNRAKYFDGVHAYATAGGHDAANLFDSAGDDNFYASPTEGALWGSGFYNRAKYFEAVYANGTAGGVDTADLRDSASPDLLEAAGNWARLSNGALDFLNSVAGFDRVKASATSTADTKVISLPLLFTLDPQGPWQA